MSPVVLHGFVSPCGQEAPASKNGAPVADVETPTAEDGIVSDSADFFRFEFSDISVAPKDAIEMP